MKATKTTFALSGLDYVEKVNASNPGLTWKDLNDNDYRGIITNLPFDINNEKYPAHGIVQMKLKGQTEWLTIRQLNIIAGNETYCDETTGKKVERPEAFSIVKTYLDPDDKEVSLEDAFEDLKTPKGEIIAPEDGGKKVLKLGYNIKSEEVQNAGFITTGQYFTRQFCYNTKNEVLSLFDYLYTEIALAEGLTI